MGRELTPAFPLLSCVCVYLNLTVTTAGCLHCLDFLSTNWPLVSLSSLCVERQSIEQVTLSCRLWIPIVQTVRQQEQTLVQPPSSPHWGYTSLFVFLQAVRLHCKHHCCIIHSRREAAVPEDWQVMGQQDAPEPHRRLEGKSRMTRNVPAVPRGILSGSMSVGLW